MVSLRNPVPRLDPNNPPATLPAAPAWMTKALCAGKWKQYDRRDVSETDAARMCAGCPVMDRCLQLAKEVETMPLMVEGVRAGMTPRQRIIEFLPHSIPSHCKHGEPLDAADSTATRLSVDGTFHCLGCTPLAAARQGRAA